MSIKTPRLIRDRCGVFYFRWIVPLSWRQILGKAEIRRSLQTKDAATARTSALLLSARMETLMAGRKTKTADRADRADVTSRANAEINAWLSSGNEANKMKIRIYKDGSADIETDTDEEAKQAAAIVESRQRGGAQTAIAALPVSRSGKTLEKARDDYLTERGATLAKGTIPKHRGALKAFIEFATNLDLALVTPAKVRDYKNKMLADKKAPTYINDHMGVLLGFFDYCINNKLVAMENPAKGLLVKGAHNKAQSYAIFTAAELGRIFAADSYLKRMKLPDLYWCPLIALYTGARAEEIASLTVEQIYAEDGIWLIDILKGKTENATRRVPIHNKLLALGLLDYHKAVSQAGHTLLFPHLIDGKNGFKKNMGRTFADHLDSPEVNVSSPLKVFHSFRHTVVTMLTDKGVNDGQKRFMVGHDIDTKTSAHDDYIHGEGLGLSNLQAAINKLDHKTVDTAKLQRNQVELLAAAQRRIDQRKSREEKAGAEEKAKPVAKKAAKAKKKA